MPIHIQAGEFLQKMRDIPVVDVRSPLEFEAGHIPSAVNVPLFTNEERVVVGTLYKQNGRDVAVLRGLEYVGPKMAGFVKQVKKVSPSKEILLHCWRGGFRSQSMAWLFDTAGFKVYFLEGGYKAYRRYIRTKFEEDYQLIVLGGKTGSGKTGLLKSIESNGHQFIDIEGIANHKGSAFGDIGQDDQPTNEQYENNLFHIWKDFDTTKPIWIEDESRGLGRVSIPEPIYNKIRVSDVIFVEKGIDLRVKQLMIDYGLCDREELAAAIIRIKKRLGGLNLKLSLEALENDDLATVAELLLQYYDKAYLTGLSIRDPKTVATIELKSNDPESNAKRIIDFYRTTR